MRFPKVLSIATFLMACVPALAGTSGITYQGRILKPDGTPLNGQYVQFKLQIRTPNTSRCLMFEEQQTLDMRLSSGAFALTINDGSGAQTALSIGDGPLPASSLGLDRVLANRGMFTFNPSTCVSGSTYAPSAGDGRVLYVLFKDETMGSWEPITAQTVNYVPYAFEADQIQGFSTSSLVRVREAGIDGAMGNISPLSNTEYAKLLLLIAGSSVDYERAGRLGGVAIPLTSSLSAGQVLSWSGSTWTAMTPAVGSGTVTRVDTSTGLTGGGFTTSGTISIAAGGVTATELADNSVTTAKILNANVTLAKLAGDSVDSPKIVDGSVAGSDLDPAINVTTSGTVVTGALTTRDLRIYQPTSGSNYIGFTTDPSTTSYYVQLPPAQGSAGTALVNNGSGALAWSPVALASQASQWTTQAPGINYLAGNVGIGTTSPNGKLEVAGQILLSGSTSGYSGFQAPATAGSLVYTLPAAAPTNGQLLSSTSAGMLSWTTPAAGGMTSLTGDVTGAGTGAVATSLASKAVTYSKIQDITTTNRLLGRATAGPGVTEEITIGAGLALSGTTLNNIVTDSDTFAAVTTACADTFVPYKSGGAWTCLQANAANANSTLIMRDSFGNAALNTLTANGVTLNNGGSLLNIVNPLGGAWTLTLPTTAGSASQVLTTDGAGLTSWTTPSVSPWNVQAPGINYVSGSVGIGTTLPNEKLTVDGVLSLKVTTAPMATTDYGKIYTKTDGKLYFKNSAGVEAELGTASGGSYTGVSSISNSAGNITLSPQATTGSVIVDSVTSSIGPASGALVVSGGVGVGGSINAGGGITATGNINAAGSLSSIGGITTQGGINSGNTTSSNVFTLIGNYAGAYTPTGSASYPVGRMTDIRNYHGTDGAAAMHNMRVENSNFDQQRAYIGAVSEGAVGTYSPSLVFGRQTAVNAYSESVRISPNGNVGIGTTAPVVSLDLGSKTDALRLPAGTSAQRPSSPTNGMARFNTDLGKNEFFEGGSWVSYLTNINANAPAGTGGTGYFVLSNSSWDGNLGGLAGANTKCQNDLAANPWLGKPGGLNPAKIFAFLCDSSSCQSPQALVNYYYAVSGEIAIGGSGFSTAADSTGPGDNFALNSTDRFGGYAGTYWIGPRTQYYVGDWDTAVDVTPRPHCLNFSSNSSSETGPLGNGAGTSVSRFAGRYIFPSCDTAHRLICFVNP